MKNEIDRVKNKGIVEALSSAMHSRIWEARRHLEDSSVDSWKDFPKDIAKAKRSILAAEGFYKEYIKQKGAK